MLLAPFQMSCNISRCGSGLVEDAKGRSENVLVRLNCHQNSHVSVSCAYYVKGCYILTVKVSKPAVAKFSVRKICKTKAMVVIRGAAREMRATTLRQTIRLDMASDQMQLPSIRYSRA
jgi:hypothetical protein